MMKVLLLVLVLFSFLAQAQAADSKWFQFNLMRSQEAKIPYGAQDDTYLEMEFGGRSGAIDLYGYVDIFDIFNNKKDDRHDGDNMFIKINPRFSLNTILGKDLSFGPVQEIYIATLANIGDRSLFESYYGLGSDIQVPWFGKMGLNLYARHVRENYGAKNEGKFDGYLASTNWFKPFFTFKNETFLTYQGYLDVKFAANEISDDNVHSSDSVEWFNGLYFHTKSYAAGYGLKYFYNMALTENNKSAAGETSGIGHYFALTYKF